MKTPLLAALCAAALSAPTAGAQTVRAYFGTDGDGIYVAELDTASGTLAPPARAIEIGRPGFLAIHPNKRFLYTIAYGGPLGKQGGVAAMKIEADGTLSLLNAQSTEGRGGCHVGIDATGKCLMVAYYGSGSVASFRILEDGSLSEAQSYQLHEGSGSHPHRQDKPYAHSIIANPSGTYAYACDLGIDKVMIYRLDADRGTLAPAGEAAVPGGSMGPRHMKWSADGKHAYVLNELDLGVSLFKAARDGQMEFVRTLSTLPEDVGKDKMTSSELRIHPNGHFIYAANRDTTGAGRDSITLFSCCEEGFQRIETIPARVRVPRNFNIDPSGKWLLVGGQESHDVAVFGIDPANGKATFTGQRIPFPCGPICIEFP